MVNHLIQRALLGLALLLVACQSHSTPVVVFMIDSLHLDLVYRIRTLAESKGQKSQLWTLIEEGVFSSEGIGVVFNSKISRNQPEVDNHGFYGSNETFGANVTEGSSVLDDWNTLANQTVNGNRSVACYDWTGCPNEAVQNRRPMIELDSWTERVKMTIEWLKGGMEVILVSYSQLSYKLRLFGGSNSTDADEALLTIDAQVGVLVSELKRRDLYDKTNLVLLGGPNDPDGIAQKSVDHRGENIADHF